MSNNYTQGSGAGGGNNSSGRKRDTHALSPNQYNGTGALPVVNTTRGYAGSFDFEEMLISLHDLFMHDRQVASQQDSKRCGICYLYFTASELYYREEDGFYICSACKHTLGKQNLPMLRRQQK